MQSSWSVYSGQPSRVRSEWGKPGQLVASSLQWITFYSCVSQKEGSRFKPNKASLFCPCRVSDHDINTLQYATSALDVIQSVQRCFFNLESQVFLGLCFQLGFDTLLPEKASWEMHPGYSAYCRGSVNIFTLLLIHPSPWKPKAPPIPFHFAVRCVSSATLT